MATLLSRLRASQQHNLHTLHRQPLSELSGSLGDLGTLLPLLIALTLTHSIDLSATLVFTGLANIATGLLFSIPLPVQPMKAIAAVAISRRFSIPQTTSAGLFVSALVALFGLTGLLTWIARVIPIPVVKGIQVGAGLSLVISAGSSLLLPLAWATPLLDNYLLAAAAFLLLLLTTALHPRRIPYALLVFLLGLLLAALTLPHPLSSPILAPWRPHLHPPTRDDIATGTLTAGLGQLPLTILNSIIAVAHLSAELLPAQPPPTPRALALSVALMNAAGAPFGAMPACHGSGGLAAQVRFGARSGASVVLLGAAKLALGLAVRDAALVGVLERFPRSLLGVMVLAAGVELARVGQGLNTEARDLWEAGGGRREVGVAEAAERWGVMMVTVAGLLAFRNDAVGVVAGLAWHWGLRVPGWVEKRRQGGARERQALLGEAGLGAT